MNAHTIRIAERFRGPPSSGNGGYVTGIVAGLLTDGRFDLPDDQAGEVTLRAPVPLDRDLTVERTEDGLRVVDGAQLIAEGRCTTLTLDVPDPPSFDEARAACPASPSLVRGFHPLLGAARVGFHPICFCCGAELAPSAGLHVYAAPIPARRQVAAAWLAPAAYADAAGLLPPEIVCTALDCPGQFAWLADGVRTGMLGRLTVRIVKPVRAGDRCVISGFTLGQEGRKYHAGTALFDAEGALCAYARAVWIGHKPA